MYAYLHTGMMKQFWPLKAAGEGRASLPARLNNSNEQVERETERWSAVLSLSLSLKIKKKKKEEGVAVRGKRLKVSVREQEVTTIKWNKCGQKSTSCLHLHVSRGVGHAAVLSANHPGRGCQLNG